MNRFYPPPRPGITGYGGTGVQAGPYTPYGVPITGYGGTGVQAGYGGYPGYPPPGYPPYGGITGYGGTGVQTFNPYTQPAVEAFGWYPYQWPMQL